MTILNSRLLSHPMNWIIILMMLIIAGIFGHLTLSLLDQEPANKASMNSTPNGYAANN